MSLGSDFSASEYTGYSRLKVPLLLANAVGGSMGLKDCRGSPLATLNGLCRDPRVWSPRRKRNSASGLFVRPFASTSARLPFRMVTFGSICIDERSRQPSPSTTNGSGTPCTNTSSAAEPATAPEKHRRRWSKCLTHQFRLIHGSKHLIAQHCIFWSPNNWMTGDRVSPLKLNLDSTNHACSACHAPRSRGRVTYLKLRTCPPSALLLDHSLHDAGSAASSQCDRRLPSQHDVEGPEAVTPRSGLCTVLVDAESLHSIP